jgi:hypothetical protein
MRRWLAEAKKKLLCQIICLEAVNSGRILIIHRELVTHFDGAHRTDITYWRLAEAGRRDWRRDDS